MAKSMILGTSERMLLRYVRQAESGVRASHQKPFKRLKNRLKPLVLPAEASVPYRSLWFAKPVPVLSLGESLADAI